MKMYPKEELYADLLNKQGRKWIYQPTYFVVEGKRYIPDFYLPNENLYIEIIGSRQRLHQNKNKILKFVETYPQINFIIFDYTKKQPQKIEKEKIEKICLKKRRKRKVKRKKKQRRKQQKKKCIRYKKIYGMSLQQMASMFGGSPEKYRKLHQEDRLADYIKASPSQRKEMLASRYALSRKQRSRYYRMYGMTLKEIAEKLGRSKDFYESLYWNGKLTAFLKTKGIHKIKKEKQNAP